MFPWISFRSARPEVLFLRYRMISMFEYSNISLFNIVILRKCISISFEKEGWKSW